MEEDFLFTKSTDMIKRILSSIVLISLCFSAFCQTDSTKYQTDSTKSPWPTITGSLDVYYRYNFANAKDPTTGSPDY